jgi:hypothetical protein
MEIFGKYEAYDFFNNLKKRIQEEISSISDDTIQNTDIDELKYFYIEKWKIQPLILFLDEINPVLTEGKVKRYTALYRTNDGYAECDGYILTYTIQFDGDNRLFDLTPSLRFPQKYHVKYIEKSSDEKYGIITYELNYTKQEIEGRLILQENSLTLPSKI